MLKKILLTVSALILIVALTVSGMLIYRVYAANVAGESKKTVLGPIYETEEFTVNHSASLNHFIKAKFAIELSNKKTRSELEEKLPLLQDSIIIVLSRQTAESLQNNEGKEVIKKDLIEAINGFLDKGEAINIYLKDFIYS